MKTRWIFTMVCIRGPEDKRVKTEEHVCAETWSQALEYWNLDIQDEATEILSMSKQVPIIAFLPTDKRK